MDTGASLSPGGMGPGTLEVRKMKEIRTDTDKITCGILTVTVIAVFLLMGISSAHASKGRNLKEKLATLRNWQLMEEFDLSPERAQKVFSILSSFDDKRAKFLIKRRKIIQDIRNRIESKKSNPDALNGLMKKLSDTNVQLAKLPEEERIALSEIFSTVEQAHYILFAEKFAKNLRRIMVNEYMNNNRHGPARHF